MVKGKITYLYRLGNLGFCIILKSVLKFLSIGWGFFGNTVQISVLCDLFFFLMSSLIIHS